ncbi:MAG: 2-oxoacid:acceptor oxidoreductase family protein [Thermoleophilia bacterium]|nr:2-oxoacid:acceptor oxidoreductase family protein [Thermoleophilia bacterium]
MSEITASGFSQPAIGTGPRPARAGLLAARDLLGVRFGGTGLQGVILMGVALAMAATRDHRYVAQTQTYGLGERGGYGHSDVIISDLPIDYPELETADLLVALCQDAAVGYADLLRPDGILVYDSENVTHPPPFAGDAFGVPFGRLAEEEVGLRDTTTIVLTLGAVVGITGVVSVESLQTTMLGMTVAGTEEVNMRALARGLALKADKWRRSLV